MSKRILRIGLVLLSILLFIVPVIAAFEVHGWNLESTVMPSEEEISRITDQFDKFEEEFEEPELISEEVNEETGEFEIIIDLKSPLEFDVKIIDFHGEFAYDTEIIGHVQLRDMPVLIGQGAVTRVTLFGVIQPDKVDDPLNYLHDASAEIEVLGITIKLEDLRDMLRGN